MSASEIPVPATLNDVLAELRLQRLETRTENLEVRGSIAEMSTRIAETKTEIIEVKIRLTTLFDELAAFRTEYNQHTHPPE